MLGSGDTKGDRDKPTSICSGRCICSGTNIAYLLREAGRQISAGVKTQKELKRDRKCRRVQGGCRWANFYFSEQEEQGWDQPTA